MSDNDVTSNLICVSTSCPKPRPARTASPLRHPLPARLPPSRRPSPSWWTPRAARHRRLEHSPVPRKRPPQAWLRLLRMLLPLRRFARRHRATHISPLSSAIGVAGECLPSILVSRRHPPFGLCVARLVEVWGAGVWRIRGSWDRAESNRAPRATWTQTELFLTFPTPVLKGITLLPLTSPETGGRFRVWVDRGQGGELVWDRKVSRGP
jgi:hypothetical protein